MKLFDELHESVRARADGKSFDSRLMRNTGPSRRRFGQAIRRDLLVGQKPDRRIRRSSPDGAPLLFDEDIRSPQGSGCLETTDALVSRPRDDLMPEPLKCG